ncbi:MAG: HyaD/HybD family hydrogenase maturation endopeptidase [Rhodospirillaceae bacterium]|nr:HyaD/HybD family hydrogenase maturation endopeptidase [Rhodospirillaceae bacterium]
MNSSTVAQTPSVLILGIGNLLWADEGFGVRAVEALHQHYEFADNVTLMDGGTQGIYLVQHVRDADILVVFDAVDYGLPPGTMKRVEGDEVPKFLGAKKISLHQTGFQEVLAMAEMCDDAPEQLLLVGVQPVELEDFGGSLRPELKAQIGPCIDLVLDYLAGFGVQATKRDVALPPETTIGCEVMLLGRYEEERPDEDTACRLGDERLLADERWQAPEDFEREIEMVLADVPQSQPEGESA